MQSYIRLKENINSRDKLLLVNIERDPSERIISHFIMKNRTAIEAYYYGIFSTDKIFQALQLVVIQDSMAIRKFRAQFSRFGFSAESTSGSGEYVSVIHGEHTLVVLQTDGLNNILNESGLYSNLVSINSTTDRGYGSLKKDFRRDFIGSVKSMLMDISSSAER
jgi:hypothetical protein